WTRILTAALLCVFCLLQRICGRHAAGRPAGGPGPGAHGKRANAAPHAAR
ncbi:sugar ABC transporter permease YjfF, partial [Burkholderia multivorans]